MTLSGIPSQLLVLPGSAASNTNIQGGIDLVATAEIELLVEALDADGNFILGPGSPTFTVSQTVGTMNVTLTPAGERRRTRFTCSRLRHTLRVPQRSA